MTLAKELGEEAGEQSERRPNPDYVVLGWRFSRFYRLLSDLIPELQAGDPSIRRARSELGHVRADSFTRGKVDTPVSAVSNVVPGSVDT